MNPSPTPALDELVHAPNRLQICAFLAGVDEAEFGAVRDLLGVSDSVTSKHLKVLEQAGYLIITKPLGQGRVRTWVKLTREGRRAFYDHVAALRGLLDSPSDRAEAPRTKGAR